MVQERIYTPNKNIMWSRNGHIPNIEKILWSKERHISCDDKIKIKLKLIELKE